MGQTADEMIGYDRQTGKSGEQYSADNPEVIRAQIEQTRNEMSGTIDAIQERLNPDHFKEHAKVMVREATIGRVEEMVNNTGETARGISSGLMETIKQNPIPAAIAGASLAWLFTHRSGSSSQSHYGYGY